MEEFRWSEEKNNQLKETRGVSFEEITAARFIGIEDHPVRSNQVVLLFEYEEHIWVVPCVVDARYLFLKTAFPSTKYTKKYKSRGEI
jgi:hypothetical protein